jgi:hypothetical protein
MRGCKLLSKTQMTFTKNFRNENKSLLGTNGALLATHTETVNEQALEKIKSILTEAYMQVNSIVLAKESLGEHPVFVGYVMNLLDSTNFDVRKQKEGSKK